MCVFVSVCLCVIGLVMPIEVLFEQQQQQQPVETLVRLGDSFAERLCRVLDTLFHSAPKLFTKIQSTKVCSSAQNSDIRSALD